MPDKRAKPPDQMRKRIVARLAAQCQVPVAEMAALFETERIKLAAGANITKLLDVFATRHALETVRISALAKLEKKPAARKGVDL